MRLRLFENDVMRKILVINGHGAKLSDNVNINPQHSFITPGDASHSYVLSFDNMNRHLEEMTCRNQIWPIHDDEQEIQWHHYQRNNINDITISPLQQNFSFVMFASSLLNKKTGWEKLTTPEHDVLERGALAVRQGNKIIVLEQEALKEYLTNAQKGTHAGTPVFFCDKELGKIKPVSDTTLSEIYTGIQAIKEFQSTGTSVIMATCSPNAKTAKNICVKTKLSPYPIDHVMTKQKGDAMNKGPSPLRTLLDKVEKNTGNFSSYETSLGKGENIPFTDKPAQQFLAGLDVANKIEQLSKKPTGKINVQDIKDVTICSLGSENPLVIPKARIERLLKSAKVYVNNDIFPKGLYRKAKVTTQDKSISAAARKHWQNLAVGVCHAQEIDLLVDQQIDKEGRAIAAPRTGKIEEGSPAILLLSTPALNFAYGTARFLTQKQQEKFIAGMYRNLFSVAVREGREYIAMPAAGLSVFGGNCQQYFKILMEVAEEFPNLNVIYHPAKYSKEFDEALNKAGNPSNIVRASKDVVFIADQLTKEGKLCALHNPSDEDAVYGIYDIGQYWKNGKGAGYVGEEHIGSMTTAPLNSKGLNPDAFDQHLVEWQFKLKVNEKAQKQFEDALKSLHNVIEKFSKNGDANRKEAAEKLYGGLSVASQEYLKEPNEETYQTFKQQSDELIQEARKTLDTVESKQILANLALAVVGLGVFYAVAIVANKALNGRFLFFPPESARKIDSTEKSG